MKHPNKYNLKTWLITMLKQLRNEDNKSKIDLEIQKLQSLNK